MKNYGTIPISSSRAGSSNLEFSSRGKPRLNESLGELRPWNEIFDYQSIGVPKDVNDAIGKIKTNLVCFSKNYCYVIVLVMILNLLRNPVSLIVFIVLFSAWISLYFLKDDPPVVLNRTVEDRYVLACLAILTIVLLFLTKVTDIIMISLVYGMVLVVIHAAIRNTETLSVDEDGAGGDSRRRECLFRD